MSSGSQTTEPYNPSSDYAEVQGNKATHVRQAQSSAAEEAEAGVKLVPRPEDVTSFESAAEEDVPAGGLWSKGTDAVGRSVDYDDREKRRREQQVSDGHADQRRGVEDSRPKHQGARR